MRQHCGTVDHVGGRQASASTLKLERGGATPLVSLSENNGDQCHGGESQEAQSIDACGCVIVVQ